MEDRESESKVAFVFVGLRGAWWTIKDPLTESRALAIFGFDFREGTGEEAQARVCASTDDSSLEDDESSCSRETPVPGKTRSTGMW